MRPFVALTALCLASCNASNPAPQVAIDDAWARASLPGQMSSAAYFSVANSGGADRLLSVSTPVGDATLHSTAMDNGVMRMRPLDGLDVPANSTVALKPGGTHVMIMGLKQPLAAGSIFPMELKFEKSGSRQVKVTVRSAAVRDAM